MRSISIRNVLRGLIATSLLAVGSDVGYGHSVGRHYALSHACFLNDFDVDSSQDLDGSEWRDRLFLTPGVESFDSIDDTRECERVAAVHDLRLQINEFLHHRAPRITNELLQGFRMGVSWIGIAQTTQKSVINQSSGIVLYLAEAVGRAESNAIASTISRYPSGNIFVYTFEEESNPTKHEAELNAEHLTAYNALQTGMDPVGNEWKIGGQDTESAITAHSHFEACFANALEQEDSSQSPANPSSTENTSLTTLGSHSIPNQCAIVEDNSALDESSVAFSVDTTEPEDHTRPPILEGDAGLGHCEVAVTEADVELLTNVPDYLASVEALPIDYEKIDEPRVTGGVDQPVYNQGVIDSWTATDWNVRHWYFKSNSLASGSPFYSSPYKRSLPDFERFSETPNPRAFADIPLDPALYTAVDPDTNMTESQRAQGHWFSQLIASTAEFTKSQWQVWQPSLEISRKQSSRVTAMQLRNIGMFFLKSASRLDATGVEAEVAGRDQTQR